MILYGSRKLKSMTLVSLIVSTTVGLFGAGHSWADPSLILGPLNCTHCHAGAFPSWKSSRHFSTFADLPKRQDAYDIARKMGVKRIKSDGVCLECHYTTKIEDTGRVKAVAGVSCESCHGPAREWLEPHFDGFGTAKTTLAKTAAALARKERAESLGMIGRGALYKMAKKCLACHIVPREDLVNVGGHVAGSKFELVSWSQGEVRHNFWYSTDGSNPDAGIEDKRKMFVVGRVVELELALAALSKATVKNTYAVKMAKRASKARKITSALAKLLPHMTELRDILAVANSAELKLNNRDELINAAGKISVLGLKLASTYTGSSMAVIDEYVPGPEKYKGKVWKK